MDRLFLDANILFSASYREDAGVAVLWAIENVALFTSPYAIEEAKRNLVEREQKKRLERLLQPLHVVQAATAPKAIRREVQLPEKDWPILGGAIAAEATHLITGDLKHFGRYSGKQIHGILVLPPAGVWFARAPLSRARGCEGNRSAQRRVTRRATERMRGCANQLLPDA